MDNKKINEIMNQIFVEMCETKKEGNVVLSPVSIVMMLAVVAVTANGVTRDEIVNAIGGERYFDMIEELSSLQKQLTKGTGFSSANAVCVNDRLKDTIVPGISEKLKPLSGEVFCSDDMVRTVNAWVSEKTNGMIPELVDDSVRNMLACIMNAVYFNGKWKEEYDEDDVAEGRFTSFTKGNETVQMLHSFEHSYVENEIYTGFVKDYANGYAFMGLLPRHKGKNNLRKALKSTDFSALYEAAHYEDVITVMPEFEAKLNEDITDLCKKMGVQAVFTPQADFSNLSKVPLMAEKAIHKARIKVSREGTEASAVSAMFVVAGCAPIVREEKKVFLNRPFVYAIINKRTGLPVFTGVQEHMGE